ncbi:hypothetical protein WSM22_39610 [Cytophagales bacterium WSM2-2]|nr:hypothetical protein WSM22_39610 [Cytophagales bacterium WSM2-2]
MATIHQSELKLILVSEVQQCPMGKDQLRVGFSPDAHTDTSVIYSYLKKDKSNEYEKRVAGG